MKTFMKIALMAAIIATLLAFSFWLHICLREGYSFRYLNMRSYSGTEWIVVWGFGLLAAMAGSAVERRLPFLGQALSLAGGVSLVVPMVGGSNSNASMKVTLAALNMIWFIRMAIHISKREEGADEQCRT